MPGNIDRHDLWEAQRLKRDYPKQTRHLSVYEVWMAWRDHSSDHAAGWLGANSEDEVEAVMERFREQREIDEGTTDEE